MSKTGLLSAKALKANLGEHWDKISARKIRALLQKAGYRTRNTARKPIHTQMMKAQRMEIAT